MRNKRFANFYKLIRENKSINFHKLMVGDKFMKSGRLVNFYKLPINKRKNFDNDFLDI